MKESISQHIENIKALITSKPIYRFDFNISEIPPHQNFNLDKIRLQHPKFKKLFADLDEKRKACLYWFECKDKEQAKQLIDILNAKRNHLISGAINNSVWKVPPPNENKNSTVIYVGARKGGNRAYDNLSNISGRISQHLGYYHKGATGALHLIQWAFGENIDMSINVIEFDDLEEKQYLYIIEKLAAIALKPLCGKH